jgi:hypothetical protein
MTHNTSKLSTGIFSDYLRAGRMFLLMRGMEAMDQLAVDLAEYSDHQLCREIRDTLADQAHYKENGAVINVCCWP